MNLMVCSSNCKDIVEDVNITIDEESIASGIVTLIVYNLSKDIDI